MATIDIRDSIYFKCLALKFEKNAIQEGPCQLVIYFLVATIKGVPPGKVFKAPLLNRNEASFQTNNDKAKDTLLAP